MNVPAVHSTVSASVTENTLDCVHPRTATSTFPSPIIPLRTEVATEPPVIVMSENVPAPVFNILAVESSISMAPHQEFPSLSV